MKKINRGHLLAAIIVLALGIRLINLNQSLWMDEAISATVAKSYSLTEIATKFILSDTHPPMYYLILRIWTQLFGFSEISLRMPSVIFGVLTVLVVYKIGKIYSSQTGIISAILISLAPLHIYYSQEARMYSLTTLLVSALVYLFFKKKWLLYSFVLLLLGMTDYLPILILVPLWFYQFVHIRDRQSIRKFLVSHFPLAVFLALWFPIFVKQGLSTTMYLQKFPAWREVLGTSDLKNLALVWIKFIIGRISFSDRNLYILVVLICSLVFVPVLVKAWQFRKKTMLLWSWLLVPIFIFFFVSLFMPGFNYFRLLFTLPAFYLLIASGISNMHTKAKALALVVTINMVCSAAYLFNYKFWREDWKTAVPFLENELKSDELVFVSYSEPFTPYIWYSYKKESVSRFDAYMASTKKGVYTLDYLMDLTDPKRDNYRALTNLGFKNSEIFNFRGVGQIRYWVR